MGAFMLVLAVPGSKKRPTATDGNEREQLAQFLRDRRAGLDPADCGFARGRRRRTPGLRREEVAQLAGISVTWYTWLEQGGRRAGVPSADVLNGIAAALRLSRAERDHLFLLAHGRPPPRSPVALNSVTVPPSMRKLIDGLGGCPALVRTSDTWDIVAWNPAAVAVFGDYAALPPASRNVLRRVFTDPAVRAVMPDWERDARRLLAGFRGGRARTGPSPAVDRLIADVSRASDAFARWWAGDRDVAPDADGIKRLRHPAVGPISLTYTALTTDAVDGLTVTMFVPTTVADRSAVDDLSEGAICVERHDQRRCHG